MINKRGKHQRSMQTNGPGSLTLGIFSYASMQTFFHYYANT